MAASNPTCNSTTQSLTTWIIMRLNQFIATVTAATAAHIAQWLDISSVPLFPHRRETCSQRNHAFSSDPTDRAAVAPSGSHNTVPTIDITRPQCAIDPLPLFTYWTANTAWRCPHTHTSHRHKRDSTQSYSTPRLVRAVRIGNSTNCLILVDAIWISFWFIHCVRVWR